jgi:hypothetical protein
MSQVIQKQARLTRYGVVEQSALTFDNSALFPREMPEGMTGPTA